jgi:hypothetical protein
MNSYSAPSGFKGTIRPEINQGCLLLSQRVYFKILKKIYPSLAGSSQSDSGQSIFDYEYNRECEEKIKKVLAFMLCRTDLVLKN